MSRRRLVATMAAVVAVSAGALATAWPARAQTPALPDVFEARAEAGAEHDSIAVPAYFETFFPYSLSEASNGSSHGYNAVFYAGFFLTAAAEQQGFPPPPGTTETLYPQGPTQASAAAIPAQPQGFGRSQGISGADGASGSATAGGGDLGPLGHVVFAQTTSAARATADAVRSTGGVVMHDLTIGGDLHIGSLTASASAVSTGRPGGATSTGSVVLADVTLSGVPVQLTPTGLMLAGSPAGLPGLVPVDQLVARAGITVARLPDRRTLAPDGTESHLQLGGVSITFARPAQEFTATITLGRLDVLARDQANSPLASAPPAVPGAPIPDVGGTAGSVLGNTAVLAPPSVAASPEAVAPRPTFRTEDIRRSAPVRGGDYSAVAALVALVTALALFTRRILAALTL